MGDAGDSAWGDTDVERDALCPESPRTADILTEEPFQRYQYRLDDFGVSFNSVPVHMCVCVFSGVCVYSAVCVCVFSGVCVCVEMMMVQE